MALKKNPSAAAANAAASTAAVQTTTGAFESQDEGGDTAVAERETEAPVATPAAAPEAAKVVQRQIVAAASTALASPLKSVQTVMEGLKDVIGGSDLEAMGIGVFPRITVGLDGFSIDKSKDLGKEIKVEVLSWNYVWLVTTGEQNDTEANKLIRTSYNGIDLKNGEGLVTDYVAELKSQEYDKATCKQYVEIYANLVSSEEKGEVDPEAQAIHQISVSPQSVGKFAAFQLETKMRKLKGILDTNVIVLRQEKKILGNNKFGVINFAAK